MYFLTLAALMGSGRCLALGDAEPCFSLGDPISLGEAIAGGLPVIPEVLLLTPGGLLLAGLLLLLARAGDLLDDLFCKLPFCIGCSIPPKINQKVEMLEILSCSFGNGPCQFGEILSAGSKTSFTLLTINDRWEPRILFFPFDFILFYFIF